MTALDGLTTHQQPYKPHTHLLFYTVFVWLLCICLVFQIGKIWERLRYVMQQS